jgi:RNA polymerase sigma factor (sigma-70 family)
MGDASDDRQLLRDYRGGDAHAIEVFYRREWLRTVRAAARRVSEEGAEDIAQEAFIRFLRVVAIKEIDNPTGYLRRIVGNLCNDRLRMKSLALIPLEGTTAALCEDPETVLTAQALRGEVKATLDQLKPKPRAALVLWGAEKRSYAQIGAMLGISDRAAEGVVARARRSFRDRFAQEDSTHESKP